MVEKPFIFIAGHHRSGTSLLHEIIREHPLISGFENTGSPEDEGQHLQDIIEPARTYGGPGKYIFDENAYMNETHELATSRTAECILEQWSRFYDAKIPIYLEKSPPTLIRTRFFQALFPNSKFLVLLRHPIATSFATRKWSKTSIRSLVEHTLKGYEIFNYDKSYLNQLYILKYEQFVQNPQAELNNIFKFLRLEPVAICRNVDPNINNKYFQLWSSEQKSLVKRWKCPRITEKLESRANVFGYSFKNPEFWTDR